MNVSLKGLPIGDWRELTKTELEGLYKLVADSDAAEPVAKNAGNKTKSNVQRTGNNNSSHSGRTKPNNRDFRKRTGKPARSKPGGRGKSRRRAR